MLRLTAKEAKRLKLNLTQPVQNTPKSRQKPRTAPEGQKADKEAYTLQKPTEATHRQVKALGDFFDNAPLMGSWAAVEGKAHGRLEIRVWNNDGGFTLMLIKPQQWEAWFQEVGEENAL